MCLSCLKLRKVFCVVFFLFFNSINIFIWKSPYLGIAAFASSTSTREVMNSRLTWATETLYEKLKEKREGERKKERLNFPLFLSSLESFADMFQCSEIEKNWTLFVFVFSRKYCISSPERTFLCCSIRNHWLVVADCSLKRVRKNQLEN